MWFLKAQIKITPRTGDPQKENVALTGIVYLILCLLISGSISAQQLRFNVYRAHVSELALTYNYLTSNIDPKVIGEGSQYGAGTEVAFNKGGSLELLYLRQTRFRPAEERYNPSQLLLYPSAINYVLLSAGGHLDNPLGEIQAYGAAVAGISITRRNLTGITTINKKAAWGARLGCTWWATKAVGVRVETLMLLSQSPTFEAPERSVTRFTQTLIHQVTLTGGVMFKIGGE